jgi:hypothetical protein
MVIIYTSRFTINKYTFCIYGLYIILSVTAIISLNSVSKLMFLMVVNCVLFEVRTEFLNII